MHTYLFFMGMGIQLVVREACSFFIRFLDHLCACDLLTVMQSSAQSLQSNVRIEEIEEDDSALAMAWSTA